MSYVVSWCYIVAEVKDSNRFVPTLQQMEGRFKYHERIGKQKPNQKSVAWAMEKINV